MPAALCHALLVVHQGAQCAVCVVRVVCAVRVVVISRWSGYLVLLRFLTSRTPIHISTG